jgi:hypothetical protein
MAVCERKKKWGQSRISVINSTLTPIYSINLTLTLFNSDNASNQPGMHGLEGVDGLSL